MISRCSRKIADHTDDQFFSLQEVLEGKDQIRRLIAGDLGGPLETESKSLHQIVGNT